MDIQTLYRLYLHLYLEFLKSEKKIDEYFAFHQHQDVVLLNAIDFALYFKYKTKFLVVKDLLDTLNRYNFLILEMTSLNEDKLVNVDSFYDTYSKFKSKFEFVLFLMNDSAL